MRLSRLALALSGLVLVSDLRGQASLETAVRTLKAGETVRIRIHGGDRIESRIISLQTEPLGIQLVGASAALDVTAIDSLWVSGRATRIGAITGAVVAGVGSFAFFAALCSGLNDSAEGGCKEWGNVTVFSVVGAAGGALVGAGLGALVPRWRLRYVRAIPVQGTVTRLRLGRLGLGVISTVGW